MCKVDGAFFLPRKQPFGRVRSSRCFCPRLSKNASYDGDDGDDGDAFLGADGESIGRTDWRVRLEQVRPINFLAGMIKRARTATH